MSKNIDKNTIKNLSRKIQIFLDSSKQSATDALKTTPKRAIQKTTEGKGDLISIKNVDKMQKYQEVHHRIVRWQLQTKQKILDFIEKHQMKDIYLLKRDWKLFMFED